MFYTFLSLDEKTLKLVVVFFIAAFLWILVQVLNKALVNALTVGTPRGKRLRTLSSIVKNTLSTAILIFVIIEVLTNLGVSLAPLLASVSIAGLAVGFGAQTLVKDVISGFFLLAEDQFDEDDDIEVAGKRGIVEKVTLRTVWLRDKNGSVHTIPNGTITTVTNFSKKKWLVRQLNCL